MLEIFFSSRQTKQIFLKLECLDRLSYPSHPRPFFIYRRALLVFKSFRKGELKKEKENKQQQELFPAKCFEIFINVLILLSLWKRVVATIQVILWKI